ncbi:MAG TPA: TonB-dependent receptor [Flavobacteriales bacterium]|nr:TonB-dependent receptor [Flavobacteriales bacterium]
MIRIKSLALALCMGLLFGGINVSLAQTGLVRGTISDAATGEALIQAAVIYGADGASQGVLTDFDGVFSIELTPGTYVLRVSYVGYEAMQKSVDVVANTTRQLNFKMHTLLLQEAMVVADIAIDRETPVAFSNIKPIQIQEELGSQPIPMLLNSTPGVYATQGGSSDGGPSITIRGFKQRNVSVLIDGIPVNDMENGGVYWNNWFGLDLVTQTMQVQRGLGASKLALPAIGGTVNIITVGIENKKKTSVKQELGSFGMMRTTLGHTSGRLDGGWGFTVAGSYKNSGGYSAQSYSKSWFYYGKVQKELGSHILSFTATGAPSQNAARGYKQRIGTHSVDYARGLFTGTDAEYEAMTQYSQAYDAIFNDGTLSLADEQAAFAELNTEYGYEPDGGAAEFEDEMTSTNYIDTTGLREMGLKYNVHWGELNGSTLYERQNKYHKPLLSLRHSWRASDKLYVSTTAYASYGHGGGTRLENSLGSGDYSEDGQVDFQKYWNNNTIGGLFGPPIDPTYSDELLKSSRILRKLYNNHKWFGVLSTFRYEHTDQLVISGGADYRTYQGEHYSTVSDLLGGDYFVDVDDNNDSQPMHAVGDTIGYHNDGFVKWGGAFALIEYKGPWYNYFINVSAVKQGYNRVDYFKPKVENEETGELEYANSGWKWIPGYTVKGGGNVNIDEWTNAFMNIGYLNRTPAFSSVIDYDNQFIQNTQNEKISSIELGVKWSKSPWTLNLNGYYTNWQNRPLNSMLRFETVDGDIVRANINSMSALHKGGEIDFGYQVNRNLTVEGFASYGDWRWTSSEDSLILLDDETFLPYVDWQGNPEIISYNAANVSVGDAPQTQIGVAVRYRKNGFYVKPRYTFFDRFYADFDPFSLNGENEGRQSWKLPAYGLLDLHMGYTLDMSESQVDFRVSAFNILNTIYLVNAQNNDPYGEWNFTDSNRTYAFTENNFDAASASVFMGYGFRSNFSVRVRF